MSPSAITIVIAALHGMYHLCIMDVYKVIFHHNTPVEAYKADAAHGDMEVDPDTWLVNWLAVECEDEQTAVEVAGKVVESLWANRSWQGS